ncbi:HD domain-containing protein [Angustibacter sp. McL0619]|uniref:HD domain-containing protein n=1 Tax=Angustibacter sp. McL0619 TaxID=3415676 RepID=UPI003CED4ACF
MSTPVDGPSDRARAWASTSGGHVGAGGVVQAHVDAEPSVEIRAPRGREEREALEEQFLQPGATRAVGAGERALAEAPDVERTCFERDRDRILHSAAFRRLAGKTQVFVYPADHQRTRLTHALEVAQVATSVARGCGLNVSLTEAIAIGHDCGHGPGGHASEDAFDAFLPGGYDHAVWGADVMLAPLNLCAQTLDGVRNHSWSRPAPSTPEGVVVSWADRVAYTAHDLEDAVHAGIVDPGDLPADVAAVCGRSRREQLAAFVGELVRCTSATGVIGMSADHAQALAGLRTFNYERIYTRPEALAQSASVVRILRALVEHYLANPQALPADFQPGAPRLPTTLDVDERVGAAVTYVGGMTDRFAFRTAVELLDWPAVELPVGIDIPRAT